MKSIIKPNSLCIQQENWQSLPTCRQSKMFITNVKHRQISSLESSRETLENWSKNTIAGHGLKNNSFTTLLVCRVCVEDEEKVEQQ